VLKLFVSNLPPDTTEQEFTTLFAAFGRVRSMQLSREIFTGKCRGFGSLEMEGHEARAAIAGLNGKNLRGQMLKVGEDRKDAAGYKKGPRRH
jgi:RNA recognition motif-containing protein